MVQVFQVEKIVVDLPNIVLKPIGRKLHRNNTTKTMFHMFLFISVYCLWKQQGHDANFSLYSPSCLSHVFCSHHSNHSGSKKTSSEVKKLWNGNNLCNISVANSNYFEKKPFLSTISEKCTTKYNEMSFRCVLCRAKILRLKQHHKGQHGPHRRPVGVPALQPQELSDASVPQSVSNYSITRLSSSSSNHSFASGKIVILFLPN